MKKCRKLGYQKQNKKYLLANTLPNNEGFFSLFFFENAQGYRMFYISISFKDTTMFNSAKQRINQLLVSLFLEGLLVLKKIVHQWLKVLWGVLFCFVCLVLSIFSLFFFFPPKIQSFSYGLLLSHTWDFKCQQIYHSIGKENPRKHLLKSMYHVLKPTYYIYYQVWQAATNKAKKIEITEVPHNSCSLSFQSVVHQQSSVTKLSAWPPLLPDFCRRDS